MFSPNEKYISFTLKMGFSDNEGQPGNFAEQYATRRESHLTALQSKEEEMTCTGQSTFMNVRFFTLFKITKSPE